MISFKDAKYDIPAGLVVFLVALPLCMGIALASGAPIFSGIIAGIIGGLIIGPISGSELSVSGPAAGLAAIVFAAVQDLGFEAFLFAVVISGIIQLVLGIVKAGAIASFFPNSVIKGMLAGIGIVIFLKQIPHALGRDVDFEGDLDFFQWAADKENTFTEIIIAIQTMSYGAVIISIVCLAILLIWQSDFIKNTKIGSVPGPLLVIFVGAGLNQLFLNYLPELYLTAEAKHLVNLPLNTSFSSFTDNFTTPDWSVWNIFNHPKVYLTALTLAIIASLETLLSIEAVDKIDPQKRNSDMNKELRAQGIGNTISGLIGGIPVTSVIVRSSTNVFSGGKTRLSAIVHGVFLLGTVALIPSVLNLIPLASLAAILLVIGYKLANVDLFRSMWAQGKDQFLPFIITIVAIVFTDLLIGILIGIFIGLLFVLFSNYKKAFTVVQKDNHYLFRFNKDVSFLNKAALRQQLRNLPKNSEVIIDGAKAQFIDHDIIDMIKDFDETAGRKNISITYIHLDIRKA